MGTAQKGYFFRLRRRLRIWWSILWYYERLAWRRHFRWLHWMGEWYGNHLLRKHGLKGWRCVVVDMAPDNPQEDMTADEMLTYILGWCDTADHVIQVHMHCPFHQYRQVMLHEIAHALVGRGGHDEEFVGTATRLGVKPSHLSVGVDEAWKKAAAAFFADVQEVETTRADCSFDE